MKSKDNYIFKGKKGIKFWWKGKWLFHSQNHKADTLCTLHLKDYKFSDLKEIGEKQYKWIFENKRPPANRNGVFKTYLIELISEDYFVIYPVVWRNEGAID